MLDARISASFGNQGTVKRFATKILKNFIRFPFGARLGLLGIPAGLALFGAISMQPAQAVLTFNIFETLDGNVVIQTDGSLNLPARVPGQDTTCQNAGGALFSNTASICTGNTPNPIVPFYNLTGPASFPGTFSAAPASSVSGTPVFFSGFGGLFGIDESYTSGTPIVSGAIYNNTTFKSLGITTFGQVGTWTLDITGDQIRVVFTPVPGSMPLIGVGAAFGVSRRLRRRISARRISGPEVQTGSR
jgi:hypothetical protein